MIAKYFKNFDKKLIKKKAGGKGPAKKGKASPKAAIDVRVLKESLSRIIPSNLTIDAVKPIDSAGFSPLGVDLVAFDRYCTDIIDLMGGYIPYEMVYGLYHLVNDLNKESLNEVLTKISTAKKLNRYTAAPEEEEMPHIPSFVIAASTKYQFSGLKNDIINYYLSKSLEYEYEMDILVVLNRGIVVKNWREKRSFIALETKDDTFMWFFILMNEYLDLRKERNIDFRNYVKKEVSYTEY
ncbi:MAG: hypothetical protein JW807_02665 [Spirochaetes bacterium]|nr:hypothetical protein [Spirochaetota bacterium]